MQVPPSQLDGADVLHYAVSKRGRFHLIQGTSPAVSVAAMAICRYNNDDRFYLFKCTADWNVVADTDCESIDAAMQTAARHAADEAVSWKIP
jgi:hypothetical protein